MKKDLLLLLCSFLFLSGLQAQHLQVNDLIGLCRADSAHIDSVMKANAYKKDFYQKDADLIMINYTYSTIKNGVLTMRSVNLGKSSYQKLFDVEYDVWKKSDVAEFAGQLIDAGFKKVPVTNISGESSSTIGYSRGKEVVMYNEMPDGSGHTIYTFKVKVMALR